MGIDKNVLYNVAGLARLKIDPDGEARLLENLNKIRQWADQLNNVNIDPGQETEPLNDAETTLRPDIPLPPLDRSRILANAPVSAQLPYCRTVASEKKKIR